MPERDLSKAEALYHAALARPPDQRERFLDDACQEDEELRREARDLLAHHDDARRLLHEPVAEAATRPLAVIPGTRLGNYEIVEQIGAGGMGEVYRALDIRLSREVAVKVLAVDLAEHPERRARLEREARALASLKHSGIATLLDVVDSGDHLALVMELVEEADLAESLSAGAVSLSRALDLAEQIAVALEHAHERGILHRDLKPSNIALGADGRTKLLDFGLAKFMSSSPQRASAETITTPPPTGPGLALGTAPYMSPEQARGQDVDRRADVWAFGCVLYEMLCGVPPFQGVSVADTITSVLERDPDFGRLPPDTPDAIRRLLRRALMKDKAQRLRDIGDAALEIRDARREATRDSPLRVGGPVEAERSRSVRLAVESVLAVAVVALFLRQLTTSTRVLAPPELGAASERSAPQVAPSAEIEHEPVGCMVENQFQLIEASITPPEHARVFFRSALGAAYYYVDMVRSRDGFVGKLPKPRVRASPIRYAVVAYTRQKGALVETSRTSEYSADVVAAPGAYSARDASVEAACPPGARVAPFGPPGAVTVLSAPLDESGSGAVLAIPAEPSGAPEPGSDLVLSIKNAFGLEDLVFSLEDPEAAVRAEAAAALGSIGPAVTRAIAKGIQRLRDPSPAVRSQAAASLSRTGERVTRQVMMALVESLSDSSGIVREAAARSLGRIGPGVAASVVALREATKDSQAEVRASAAQGLGSVGSVLSSAISALEKEAADGAEVAAREAAGDSLSAIQAALTK